MIKTLAKFKWKTIPETCQFCCGNYFLFKTSKNSKMFKVLKCSSYITYAFMKLKRVTQTADLYENSKNKLGTKTTRFSIKTVQSESWIYATVKNAGFKVCSDKKPNESKKIIFSIPISKLQKLLFFLWVLSDFRILELVNLTKISLQE